MGRVYGPTYITGWRIFNSEDIWSDVLLVHHLLERGIEIGRQFLFLGRRCRIYRILFCVKKRKIIDQFIENIFTLDLWGSITW